MAQDVWTFTENAATYVENVADLWHWSTNYDAGRNPFVIFLDLIGFSSEEYGEPMFQGDPSGVLGYVEIGKLAAALTEYADRPQDVTAWITDLMAHENA